MAEKEKGTRFAQLVRANRKSAKSAEALAGKFSRCKKLPYPTAMYDFAAITLGAETKAEARTIKRQLFAATR